MKYESLRLDNLTEEQKKLAQQLNFTEDKMLDFLEMVQIQKSVDALNKLKDRCLGLEVINDPYVQELEETIELYKKRYSTICDS